MQCLHTKVYTYVYIHNRQISIYNTNKYKLYIRYYRHNIVGRLILPSYWNVPSDISGKFLQAYTPTYYDNCGDLACWSKKTKLNTKLSVIDTWSNLYNQGLSPVMLHVYIWDRIWDAHLFDGRLLIVDLINGECATLIAESYWAAADYI